MKRFLSKAVQMGLILTLIFSVGCKKTPTSSIDQPVNSETVSGTSKPSSSKNPSSASPSPSASPKITSQLSVYTTEVPEETVPSLFTGIPIYKSFLNKRPVAVVINNLPKALPQSGISQADIIYEVLVEGDITRLVAVFQDYNSGKIGPVRSTREYFADFALDNSAILVHHGGSETGKAAIKNYSVNNLDGMQLEGKTFWRDPERMKQSGMYEHSSYTDTQRLNAAIAQYKYADTINEEPRFLFYDKLTELNNSESANTVRVTYSASQNGVFEYDKSTGLYLRYQGKGSDVHVDEETGKQLSVANVIVQLVSMKIVDNEGRRSLTLVSEGKGYLATAGTVVPITWKKGSHKAPTEWYFEDGTPITLNKGKTWINVFQSNGKVSFE